MNTSLLRVRNESKAYFAEHKMVKSFYWGDFIDIYAENQIEHSTVVIQATRVTNMNRHNVDIQVFISYADRVFSDHSNLDEVQSQAIDVLNDFVMVLTTAPRWREFVTGATSGNAELFFNRTGDLVAGAVMTVTISTKTTADLCAIPVRDYDYGLQPQPLPTCEPVTYLVEYANGDPIESGQIPSGGSVVVVVPNPEPVNWTLFDTDGNVLDSGTEPLGGVLNIVAPDATFSINGTQVATIPSGGSDSIQVRKATGSNQIGSLQGQYWRIPNSMITLKDTANNTLSTTNVPATESENIVAPDGTVTVNRDGVLYTTQDVASGGTATVNVPSADWARPTDWLPMPTVTSADQTFVGLHAVIEDGDNYVAFNFTTSTGQYQVDWGDGNVDLINSGVNAEHQYDFATYDTGNTTLTSRGYKQAMITVTPVSGDLLTCNFQQRYVTVPPQNQAYSTGFLDCILSMPNASSGASIEFGGTTVRHTYVERVNVLTIGGAASMFSMFYNCNSLQSVPLFDTANVTNMSSMFYNCYSLQSVPLFNTSNVLFMSNMFRSCYSLQSVPLFDTANVTSMGSMFRFCNSLQSVPLFNTANVTNMSSMFNDCRSLNSIPALSTASITTDFGGLFARACTSLNRCQMVFQGTVSFEDCQLSRDAIVEIFNNLATVTPTQTIIITGNWGVTALSAADLLIATNKGWTVIQ